jgi:predicted alpha/beta-fold hydrolase
MRFFAWLMLGFLPFAVWSEEAKKEPPNWYDGFIFKERSFIYEFIRTLGYSVSGAADLGESIATASAIIDKDIYSWKKEWQATADRIYALAQEFERKGDHISAKEAYFRASNYYRTAGFFLCAKKDRSESISLWEKSVSCFRKGAAFALSLSPIEIPYDGTTLPGYLIRSEEKNAPLLIIHTGFDGTKEELYFEAGLSAAQRGYNVLLFEGPGQGEVLRKQNLPFRYDWEKVIKPVVDYAHTLDFINKEKIALLGISLGGYLAARAAAFEHRLAACIVNGGIFDFSENIYRNMPLDVIKQIQDNPHEFNQMIEREMAKSVEAYWFYHNAIWTMHAETPAEVMRCLQRYTLKDVIQLIKCPMLVIDSESDLFLKGQPQKVFDELKSPKTLLSFSSKTTAQAHCQMGAIMISNESIFSWLDRTLGHEAKRLG